MSATDRRVRAAAISTEQMAITNYHSRNADISWRRNPAIRSPKPIAETLPRARLQIKKSIPDTMTQSPSKFILIGHAMVVSIIISILGEQIALNEKFERIEKQGGSHGDKQDRREKLRSRDQNEPARYGGYARAVTNALPSQCALMEGVSPTYKAMTRLKQMKVKEGWTIL